MLTICNFLSSLCNCFSDNDIAHTTNGTQYGQKGVSAYVESNHGPDGSLFLDPYFKRDLENSKGKVVLDAGCGAAPWSIYAAQHGGQVFGVDIQDGMVDAAKTAIKKTKLEDRITIQKGNVANLPFDTNFFDRQISICVGCNLPLDVFDKHFYECYRTLKEGGVAVIGAPHSLDVVFSNGSKTEAEIQEHIQTLLKKLPDNPSSELIFETLLELNEVLSATFYIKDNRLTLATDEKALKTGEKIWRKLPKVVVPNRFYSKEHYAQIFKKYDFVIDKIDLPHFKSEAERVAYNNVASPNAQLGKEYISHAPFVIYHIKKPDPNPIKFATVIMER